ncbi:CapA family protein [Thioalkalivibrio versutus]|uniref:CapA family protein n=1 Tax=Thioalkalivibrio versutus TaxID=106634 RepID=UPI001300DA1A|nr:CapA family protein [Thioalkalivibrio versutus]
MSVVKKRGTIKLAGDWAPGEKKVMQLPFSGKLIINLEGPVIKNDNLKGCALNKAGPLLSNKALPRSREGGVLVLSNNHFFDYGEAGRQETCEAIQQSEWESVGAGSSQRDAQQPLRYECDGFVLGIISYCERQFGVSKGSQPGVAGYDPSIFYKLRKIKEECDLVIVSVHAAAELVPWPSPERQDAWRALIDAGADIVHGHHAHVPQGWEEYNGGWIFYGLGNFCVDPNKWRWHPNGLWSLAPEIAFEDNQMIVDVKTVVIDEIDGGISLRDASESEADEHGKYLHDCTYPLRDRELLEGIWQEASLRLYHSYYAGWLDFDVPLHKQLLRASKRKASQLKNRFFRKYDLNACERRGKKKNLLRYHLFACDSHNQAISTALGVLGGEIKDLRTSEALNLIDKWMITR